MAAAVAFTITPEMLEMGIELVPVPAAHLIRLETGWQFEAFNRAYRLTGLGVVADRSVMVGALAAQLDVFKAGDLRNMEFDWSTEDGIGGRHYRVGLGRISTKTRRCTVTLLDQTARLESERSLRREMTTDSLTGLPNREGFGDLLETASAAGQRFAVLVIDLVRFGRINACMGSLVGDELLITVARRIKGALRARDALARIGGDEFGVMMLVDADGDEADALATRIVGALQAPFRLTDFEIGVECSIGIAIGAEHDGAAEGGDDAEARIDGAELIRHAQFAVKRAKATGHVETYQPRAFSVARAQFAMETQLRRAIEERRLRLTYQPICHLGSGRTVAFEALARWRGEDGRDHSPTAFIPVAEESGLIVPLGRWAIDEAARTLAGWDAQARKGGRPDCGVKLAVNLSAIQLQRDNVSAVLESALDVTGLGGDRFTLELTESAIVGDPDGVARAMHALKALGTTLAMDDFGTGYSNLAYLQQLPIDILKIDRTFVTGMLADRDKVAIVRAVLSLAQALGKQTTAEGVETNALAQTLAALGCTFGQGYYYARPLEASAAWRMIASTTESAIDSTRG
ncbi:putative bifunctional diguanylate cyclase/phosphodiesterase [Sphingomonas sp.]|uniref:putative bifunctional diguanylate cyclase/phosphodiesterase n=1 Tax=Sphingomonas sp. TaxID=28214 RepID=UPI003CC662E6